MTATSAITPGYAQTPRYSVVISELMADPTPVKGLPESEFIELYNTGSLPVSLRGWSIKDRSGTGTISTDAQINPGEYVILCASGSASAFSQLGKTVVVTRFPSLDNAGDLLVLEDASGNIIHALEYTLAWYGNKLKEEGGWTLEMIDVSKACQENAFGSGNPINWCASSDPRGGTPGQANRPEKTKSPAPELKTLYSFVTDDHRIQVCFNLPLQDGSVPNLLAQIPDSHSQVAAELLPPFFQEAVIRFDKPLDTSGVLNLKISYAGSCGNFSEIRNETIKTAYPRKPEAGALRINELLFNPRPPVEDFVELINCGKSAVGLTNLRFANRNSRGEINQINTVSSLPRLIFPGECIAFTTNPEALSIAYLTQFPDQLLRVNSLPSMPNDKGSILLLDDQGEIIDEVGYSEKWHHPLLRDASGVSLERIFPRGNSNSPENWQSASSASGFATPGYTNSQSNPEATDEKTYSLPYTLFTPNLDGERDLLFVHYELEEEGWIASVRIFHPEGWPVRILARQFLMGRKGFFRWDGTNDKHEPMASGHYLIVIERFHSSGKTHLWKKVISLIR